MAYNASGIPTGLWPGDSAYSYAPGTTKAAAVAAAGNQVALGQSAGNIVGLGAQIKFSADPGTMQIDVQVSNTSDTDAAYATIDSITGVDANFNARRDYSGIYGNFARLKAVTITNDVTMQGVLNR